MTSNDGKKLSYNSYVNLGKVSFSQDMSKITVRNGPLRWVPYLTVSVSYDGVIFRCQR